MAIKRCESKNAYVTLNSDRYPAAFDVSKQKDKLKFSVVDIQIKANFTKNASANTRAFALVISDKMLSFQPDGNRMFVIY